MEGRMTARRIGLAAALVTLAAAGWYVFVYLARWEWNRALMAGVIFLAAELCLLGLLLLDRLARLEQRLDERLSATAPPGRGANRRSSGPARPATTPDPRLLDRLHEAAPPSRRPFEWLDPMDRMSVFVPVLLGAGVLLSGAAWVVERVARLTGGPALERRLATRLDGLSLPPGGLLDDDEAPDPFSPS
jgi:hypothetical protein